MDADRVVLGFGRVSEDGRVRLEPGLVDLAPFLLAMDEDIRVLAAVARMPKPVGMY